MVGDLVLTGDAGEISVRAGYVDSWLICLDEGLEKLRSGRRASVEIPEDGRLLAFQRKGSGVRISYRAAAAEFASLTRIREEVIAAARRLVARSRELGIERVGSNVAIVERIAARPL